MRRVAVAILLFCSLGFAQQPKHPIKTDVQPGAPRYQLFVNPEVRADTFLLDTVTGKVWQRTHFSSLLDEPDAWIAQDRIDSDEEFLAWFKKHVTKEEAKAAGITK